NPSIRIRSRCRRVASHHHRVRRRAATRAARAVLLARHRSVCVLFALVARCDCGAVTGRNTVVKANCCSSAGDESVASGLPDGPASIKWYNSKPSVETPGGDITAGTAARQAGQGLGNDLRLRAGRPPPPAGASPKSGGRLGRVQEDEGAFGRYGAVKAVGSTRSRGLEDVDDPSRRGRVASPEKRAPVAGRTLGLARRDPSVLPAAERVLPRDTEESLMQQSLRGRWAKIIL
ncbi:hypothetical protein THAOC_31533, partial [Thalassiosira oceanica]